MFNTTNGGYSLADVAAATRGNDEMFGNGAWWIIILFLFCFNGGWGNNGFNGGADLGYQLDMQTLQNGQTAMAGNVANGFYNLNTSLLTGFGNTNTAMQQGFNSIVNGNLQNTYALSNQLNSMAATQAQCCCENKLLTENKFDELNYNLATQACEGRRATADATRSIIDNNNENTRSILDFLTQSKIDSLSSENAVLKNQVSQYSQNAYLLEQLRPTPIPSYIVTSPYQAVNYGVTAYSGFGCGCPGSSYNYNGCNALA